MHTLHKEPSKIHKQVLNTKKLSIFTTYLIGFHQKFLIIELKIIKIKIFLRVPKTSKYIIKTETNFLINNFLKQEMLILEIFKNQILILKGN